MNHPGQIGRIALVVTLVVSALVVDSGGSSPASAAGTEYRDAVLADGPLAYWRLGESAGSTAADETGGFPATYLGNPGLGGPGLVADADSAPAFDGVDDLVFVPDADAINLQPVATRTIEAWFQVSDVNRRQVVVEEGGITRGLTIYVDEGQVYFGGWNRRNDGPDAPWGNIFFSTPVTADTPHHVVLVLDAAAGTLSGYLDGLPAGSSNEAGTLYWHGSDTGIAAMKDASRFHDSQKGGNGFHLEGVVDEVAFYNSVLPAAAVAEHYQAGVGSPPVDPSVGFVSPSGGEVVSGVVTVEVVASDPQDAVGGLGVEVSVDGGVSFVPAVFDAGSGFFELVWDTSLGVDGAVVLVANVVDSDGNVASDSVAVTVNNAPPGAYVDAVLASGPDVYWRLGESVGLTAVDVVSGVDAVYSGGPVLGGSGLVADVDAAPDFDGVDDFVAVPNSGLINTATRELRTVALWFRADDVVSRQVLFEEGGITRGMSIYVDQSRVYLGAWNSADDSSLDTPWAPAFLSAPIQAGEIYNVVLVLDQPSGTLEGFVNGVSVGTEVGGTLHYHSSANAIGAMDNAVVFHDGNSGAGSGFFFDGVIDEVAIYNSVLEAATINDLYLTGSALATNPSVMFVAPANAAIVSGAVTIDVAASDPQDAEIDLAVDISTDGGGSFSAASFNPATLRHNLGWDTTLAADGPTTLVARVTDTDGNTRSTSISVTVSNAGATAMIIAAGDISTCQNTNDSDTANLIDSIIANTALPVTVVPVGDLVYDDGTLQEFNDCYDPTWGRHKAITKPVPGNHEYNTPNAAGYDAYFGEAAHGPDFYYRYELAGWEIYALNSNCGWIGGCDETAAQVQWLRSELAASTNACTMSFFHFPRFVDENPVGHPLEFWKALYEYGGDVVVNGHAHFYAESLPQDWEGNLDPVDGIRQFISGAGGRSHYQLPTNPHPNLDRWNNTDYGVMVFELAADSYTWHFINVDGVALFSGSANCN
jgi:hypothetical protein